METRILLTGFPVVVVAPLHWGDQDALGHVNNTLYLRWAETARIDYLTRIGLWQRYEVEKIGPILASISCNFLRPLTYPDTIHTGARVARIGNTSFVMEHAIFSVNENATAAELSSTLVLYDYNANKPVPMSPDLREAIARLEGEQR